MTVEVLDGRITMDTAADALAKNVRITAVNWTGGSSGHVLLLDDTAGKELVGGAAETANLERYWYFGEQGIPATGLVLTTIGGGRITIYVK